MKLQQAAALNQHGANLLAVGNYNDSYRALGEAATILRDLLFETDEPELGMEGLSICSGMGCGITLLGLSGFHIFNRDFQFQISHPTASRSTLCQKRYCVAIVMFNMALGRHAQAKQLGRDKYLEKALSLYSMCLDVLRQVKATPECVTILAMAALNNMAAVCYDLGDISKSKRLLAHLAPLASSLTPAAAARCQAEEMFMNQLLTGFVTTARCA